MKERKKLRSFGKKLFRKLFVISSVSVLLLVVLLLLYTPGKDLINPPHLENVDGRFRPVYSDVYGYLAPSNANLYTPLTDNIWTRLRTNGLGFRAFGKTRDKNCRGGILALGDSLFFGYGISDQNTFLSIIADSLHKCLTVAAIPGWGASQMYVAATNLIPLLSPKIVIVQNSPWLYKRALRKISPIPIFKIYVPFVSAESPFVVSPPIKRAAFFDYFPGRFEGAPPSEIFWHLAALAQATLKDNLTYYRMSIFDGSSEIDDSWQAAYWSKIFDITIAHAGTFLILDIGAPGLPPKKVSLTSTLQEMHELNTFVTLSQNISQNGKIEEKNWYNAYGIVDPKTNRLIDKHYNERANMLVAQRVLHEMKRILKDN